MSQGIYTLPKSVLLGLMRMLAEFEGEDPQTVMPMGAFDEFENKSAQIFSNESGETIPPFACMKVTGSAEDGLGNVVAEVEKPDETGGPFLFNGEHEVGVGEYANGFTGEVRAYTLGSPATGETWGPKSGWDVVSDGDPAILIWGSAEEDAVMGRTVDAQASGLFVVELQHVGGEDGSSSAQCTWRYDISKVGNDEILKADDDIGLDPNKYRRINLGKYTQATHGIACFLEGELSVMTSNEVPVAGTC